MKNWRLSRRGFLRLALLSAIAGSAGIVFKSTEEVGFERWFRWVVRGNIAHLFAAPTRVALVMCPSYASDLGRSMRDAWQKAGLPNLSGLRVVLKPNLVDFIGDHPAYTNPEFIRALIQFAREQGALQITVAEGPSFRRDAQGILDGTGVSKVLESEGIPFVDLNYDDLVSVPLKGGYTRMKTLLMARTVAEADLLVSMPKLKTHHWTGMSGSVKNLFGIVPGLKYGWPKNTLHVQGIPAFLAELTDSLPTRACAIVDGILGMEGDGPIFGSGVPSGVIVAGTDLVAVDATCARLMGFQPSQVDYLQFAGWAGVGTVDESKIEIVGETLAGLRRAYARPPTME